MTGTNLLARKLLIAFIVGFCGPLVAFLSGLGASPEWHFDKAAVVSLITGCLAAGIRAVLAFGPINLVPSDAQHSLTGLRHETAQVNPIVIVLLFLILIVAFAGYAAFSPWWLLVLVLILLLFFL